MIKVLLNLLFQKLFNHENITMIQKLKYSSISILISSDFYKQNFNQFTLEYILN